MARHRFDDDEIPGLYALAGVIAVESLPRIFETDFEYVGVLLLPHTLEVIVVLEFAASLTIHANQIVIILPGDGTAPAAIELYVFVLVH